MATKTSPLKLGNEIYGTIKIEEAFLTALKMYFIKQQEKNSWLIRSFFVEDDNMVEMVIQFCRSIHTLHQYKHPNTSIAKPGEVYLDNIIGKRYLTTLGNNG
ncbi:hypothetical protein [Bacillus mycoides]|uniref:hypothetical protein n=1 Tax=Bacillus mycoides TaxID=1405 RepID=UPI001F141DA6|nr:hypothetical protein [Bacillus mycoides]